MMAAGSDYNLVKEREGRIAGYDPGGDRYFPLGRAKLGRTGMPARLCSTIPTAPASPRPCKSSQL
jgi:hypothetical protein